MEPARYDVVVVGSGFGGAVSALRLAEKGYRVLVLEAGRRWRAEDFPRSTWQLRRFVWMPRLGLRGIQRLTLLRDVLVLSGAGVGGGSLVYANTLHEPDPAFYDDPQWAAITDWRAELAPHFDRARRMLGAVENPLRTPADELLGRVAARMGAPGPLQPATVGVYFGRPGVAEADPYFGGAGPDRTGCTGCGGCMVGCRVGAKNSLDRNYLWLAERLGVEVRAEQEVVGLRPDGGAGADGWVVEARRPGPGGGRHRSTYRAGQVVLAAGVLGTLRLLLRENERSLPALSPRLGHLVRTNSEAIVGASAPDDAVDYSRGLAITSQFRPDADTRIEPVRYPAGSNAMGLLATLLVDGGGRLPRQVRFAGQVLRHPVRFARSLSVRHWSQRTVVLLVMQSLDSSIRVVRRGRRLTSRPGHGPANPTYLPVANRAARLAAEELGGQAQGSVFEALLDTPTTAHVLGGCCIGADAATGVVDAYHRVFGHPGLHVLDGSAVPANLGANPSLTITALAERAMAHWPRAGEPDRRPPLGAPYRPDPGPAR